MNGELWSVGECMLELRPQVGAIIEHGAAGDTFNTAVYLKRLMPQLTVRFLSALGDDRMSALIRKHMQSHGIDDTLTPMVRGGVAGLYAIDTDSDGERHFSFWRSQSAARSMLGDEHVVQAMSMLGNCQTLVLSGISLAILNDRSRTALLDLAAHVRRAGGRVVLDNNYRAALWDVPTARHWLSQATQVCTHALFSQDDELAMCGASDPVATLVRMRDLGVAEPVVKLGAKGCLLVAENGETVQIAAHVVRAVDTTAAGDSFNAGYLAARMKGAGRIEAARAGSDLAGVVVQHLGAIIPVEYMPADCMLDDNIGTAWS